MKLVMVDTDRYVPTDIEDQDLRNDMAKSIREFYFDDKPVSNENISNFVNVSAYLVRRASSRALVFILFFSLPALLRRNVC